MKAIINSLFIAFSTYSRIPTPHVEWNDENRRYTMCFFPLIGGAVGLVMWLWLLICERAGIGGLLKGAVGAVIPLLVTGGIHMDGFMDTCDALASWQPRERRLEILKDSHTGAFAVIGCASYMLLMAGLLSEARVRDAVPMCMCMVLSRALSAFMLTLLTSARPQGMLDGFKQAAQRRMVGASCGVYGVICLTVWLVCGAWVALLCLLAAAGVTLYYRHMAYKQFGGVTGDLAGWYLQITELCCIAAALLGGRL